MSEDTHQQQQQVEHQLENQQAAHQERAEEFNQDQQANESHHQQDHIQDQSNNEMNESNQQQLQQQDEMAVSQNMEGSQDQQGNQEEQKKEFISILNFNPQNKNEPILDSPRSLQACHITGISPNMLVVKTDEDVYKLLKHKANLNEEGTKMITENFEQRRLIKVDKVKQARENIINDNLTRDERKKLMESTEFENFSRYQSEFNKTESNFGSTINDAVQSKLEKSKYIQNRQTEIMIRNEIKSHKMYQEQEIKDERIRMIAEQKEKIMKQRRIEFEENQQQKKTKQEDLRTKDANFRLKNEQEYQLKQMNSNKNLNELITIKQKIRQEESDKKLMKINQAAQTIILQDEQRRQKVEKKYFEKEQKYQQKQELFQQHLANTSQKRDDKSTRAYQRYLQLNQENFERLENNRQEQLRKQAVIEERQKLMEKMRQNQQLYVNEEAKRAQTENNSYDRTNSVKNTESEGKKTQDWKDQNKRRQQETLNKRNMNIWNEQQKKDLKHKQKSQAAIEKAEVITNI